MTQRDRHSWLIICLLIAILLIGSAECKAGDWKISLLPKSWHHGSTDTTNEKHDGIMISYKNVGVMHYTNSYGTDGLLLSYGRDWRVVKDVYVGGFVAYSDTYLETGHSPYLGGLTLRWDWITILSAPNEVTAIKFTVFEF